MIQHTRTRMLALQMLGCHGVMLTLRYTSRCHVGEKRRKRVEMRPWAISRTHAVSEAERAE